MLSPPQSAMNVMPLTWTSSRKNVIADTMGSAARTASELLQVFIISGSVKVTNSLNFIGWRNDWMDVWFVGF